MSEKLQGRIKFYNESKGYGFITDTESAKDYFFHVTGLLEAVQGEDLVEFDIEEGQKGPQAQNVVKL